jgi:hypothetical protein
MGDFGLAMETFHGMSETASDAPFTRFLMFKVALKTSDKELGMK